MKNLLYFLFLFLISLEAFANDQCAFVAKGVSSCFTYCVNNPDAIIGKSSTLVCDQKGKGKGLCSEYCSAQCNILKDKCKSNDSNTPQTNENNKVNCIEGDCLNGIGKATKGKPDSGVFKGKFLNGGFDSGLLSYDDGASEEGKFNPTTNRVKEGKVVFKGGDIWEGFFENGIITKGKKIFTDGLVLEGVFDLKTTELIEGSIILPPPSKARIEGKFQNSKLLSGKLTYEDGSTEEGNFDISTGKLIKGIRIYADGREEKGKFDARSGNFLGTK